MLISEAYAAWKEMAAELPQDDRPMLSEDWNNYTDSLCKDGEFTDLQYHYCPAFDDEIPGDAEEEREYMLQQLGITMASESIAARPENPTEWPEGTRHFRVTLSRGAEKFTTDYSMGPALRGRPDLSDVLHCLLTDVQGVEGVESFEEWAGDYGYDTDSRRAEQVYNACVAMLPKIQALFSDVSLEDLNALFEDY